MDGSTVLKRKQERDVSNVDPRGTNFLNILSARY